MKVAKFLQGVANNLVWFFNISLAAGLLGAIGITVWYTEFDGGWKFVKQLREDEVKENSERSKRM